MKRILFSIAILLACVLYLGCIPEKRLSWSRDGSRALVRMQEDRLVVLEGSELKPRDLKMQVMSMDWLADSRHAIVVRQQLYKDWTSLKPRLTAEEVEKVERAAKDIIAQVMAYQGPIDKMELRDELLKDGVVAEAAILYARDTASQEFRDKVGPKWKDMSDVEASIAEIVVVDVAADTQSAEPPIAAFLAAGRVEVFADPTGQSAAVLLPRPQFSLATGQPAYALAACNLKRPGSMTVLDTKVGACVAWSPDGRQMAYFRYEGSPQVENDDMPRLGHLTVREFSWNETGTQPTTQKAETRVGVVFYAYADLEYLPDDSLIFAAMPVQLPAATGDMPMSWAVYRWDPRYPRTVNRLMDAETMKWFDQPHDQSWVFSLSPDGKRLLLIGSKESKKLYICNLQAGQGSIIEGIQLDEHGIRPQWQGNQAISAMVVPGNKNGSPTRNELVLFQLDSGANVTSSKVLSAGWPDEWTNDWFNVTQPTSQPATAK